MLVATLANFALPATHAAAQEITLIAPAFTELVMEDGGGLYQILVQEAALRSGSAYRERFLPQKRAYEEFIHGSGNCIYDYTAEALKRLGPGSVMAGYPLHPFRLYIFTARQKPAISTIDDLRGKVVGGVLGYEDMYKAVIPDDILIEYVSTDQANIGKLNKGRVDAILGFLPDLGHYAYGLSFDHTKPLFERFDRLTCKTGPGNREFLRRMSAALREMHLDGTMARIMGQRTMWFRWEDDELMP